MFENSDRPAFEAVTTDERIARALGTLVGTIAATGVVLASFFLLFGCIAPPGLFPVFVTVALLLALIPGLTAGVRLASSLRAARHSRPEGLDASTVISRSIWSALIINAIFAGLGMVASMGMLVAVLMPYLMVSSVLLAAIAAALGWVATRLTARYA